MYEYIILKHKLIVLEEARHFAQPPLCSSSIASCKEVKVVRALTYLSDPIGSLWFLRRNGLFDAT